MNPMTLFFNAIRALIKLPQIFARFIWNVVRGEENAILILEDELPTLIFVMSPALYFSFMVVALVTLMTSGGIQSTILQVVVSLVCNLWIFVTISLGLQSHDTRLLQAQSIQYYLLFVGFLQTLAWFVHPDVPRNEPASVFILFLATSVTFVNEKVVKPMIERYDVVDDDTDQSIRYVEAEPPDLHS